MLKQSHLRRFILTQAHSLFLFDPYIGPNQVPPLRAKEDLRVMAIKGRSVFSEATALLEPHHQSI